MKVDEQPNWDKRTHINGSVSVFYRIQFLCKREVSIIKRYADESGGVH